MVSRRVAGLAVLAGALCALFLLPDCGPSREQTELDEYSKWVDERHARQNTILQPIEIGRGSLESFVNELPRLRKDGELLRIYAGARGARESLARIRDEVRPTHATFRKTVEAMRPEFPALAAVHDRLRRAVELRERGIVTMSAVADLVDALLEIAKEKVDPTVQQKVQSLVNEVLEGVSQAALAFQKSDQALNAATKRTVEALVAAGQGDSDLRRQAEHLVATQGAIFRGFAEQMSAPSLAAYLPALTAVESRMIPDFDKIVGGAAALDMPAGAAREAWVVVIGILRNRADALRPLPALREKIEALENLAQGTPAMRAIEIVDRILERVPSAGDDLQQALGGYRNFATELRRLRADVL